jgi:hypothetical protein
MILTTPNNNQKLWQKWQTSKKLTTIGNYHTFIRKLWQEWTPSRMYQNILTIFIKFWQQLEETDISDNNSTNSQKFLTTRQQDINPKLSEHYLHNNQENLKTTSKKQTILTIIRKFRQHFTTIRNYQKLWNYQNILTIIRKYNTDTNNYSNNKKNLTKLQQ